MFGQILTSSEDVFSSKFTDSENTLILSENKIKLAVKKKYLANKHLKINFKDYDGYFVLSIGYLFNKLDLTNQLPNLNNSSDTSDLIKNLYCLYGSHFIDQLRGSLLVVIWDKRLKKLVSTQTLFTNRVFYYYRDKGSLYFSTLVKPLLEVVPVNLFPNIQKIREVYSFLNVDQSREQYYKGVYAVYSNEIFKWSEASGIDISEYWNLKQIKRRRFISRAESYSQFKTVFERDIENFIGVAGSNQIASDLSGGLDSSSISAVLAHALRKQQKSLLTISFQPDISDYARPVCKSRAYCEKERVESLKNFYGNINVYYLKKSDYALTFRTVGDFYYNNAGSIALNPLNVGWLLGRYPVASKHKAHYLLSGVHGNFTISFGKLPGRKIRFILKKLIQLFNPNFKKKNTYNSSKMYLVDQQIKSIKKGWKSLFLIQDKQAKEINDYIIKPHPLLIAAPDYMEYEKDIVTFDPAVSRDIVEACLMTPKRYFYNSRKKLNRTLIREALKDYLPDDIRLNKSRGEQNPIWMDELKDSLSYYEELLKSKEAQNFSSTFKVDEMLKDLSKAKDFNMKSGDYIQFIQIRLALARALHVLDWLVKHKTTPKSPR